MLKSTKFKEYVKRVPLAVPIYRTIRGKNNSQSEEFLYSRTTWTETASSAEIQRLRILNILNYTKRSGSAYSANKFPAGYHEIEIGGEVFAGQRNPKRRLDLVPIDFSGKTVLDIGSNQGGMIFALDEKIKWAVGLDYDYKMVNASNLIAREMGAKNCNFYVFDIDRDPHDLIFDLLPEQRVDVVFLLSVCMWVDKWREIIRFAATISNTLVFESNGSDQQQSEQIAFLDEVFQDVTTLAKTSEDDPGQKKRQLLIAHNLAGSR